MQHQSLAVKETDYDSLEEHAMTVDSFSASTSRQSSTAELKRVFGYFCEIDPEGRITCTIGQSEDDWPRGNVNGKGDALEHGRVEYIWKPTQRHSDLDDGNSWPQAPSTQQLSITTCPSDRQGGEEVKQRQEDQGAFFNHVLSQVTDSDVPKVAQEGRVFKQFILPVDLDDPPEEMYIVVDSQTGTSGRREAGVEGRWFRCSIGEYVSVD